MTPVVSLIVIGLVFGALGGGAYAGVWRSWLGRLHDNIVFGLFWLGIAALCVGIAAALVRTPVFGFSFVAAAIAAVTGGIGLWTLLSGPPRWAQPRWYRTARQR